MTVRELAKKIVESSQSLRGSPTPFQLRLSVALLAAHERIDELESQRDNLFLQPDVPSFEYWKERAESAEATLSYMINVLNLLQKEAIEFSRPGRGSLIKAIQESQQALSQPAIDKFRKRLDAMEKVIEKSRNIGFSYIRQSTYGFDDLNESLAKLDKCEDGKQERER